MNSYNERFDIFLYYDEIDVVLSLLDDKQLLKMKDGIQFLSKEIVYNIPNFPLSAGGLSHLVNYINYELARRVGKGITIVNNESVVCEKKDSPWVKKDWRELSVEEKEVSEDNVHMQDEPESMPTISDEDKVIETLPEMPGIVGKDDISGDSINGDWV